MFDRLAVSDTAIIARGFIILLAIIVVGVGVAEHQLAALTQRHEQERFFYIGRNQEHSYSIYAFGYGLTFRSIYLLGKIGQEENKVVIDAAGYSVAVPTRVTVDSQEIKYWIKIWQQQFADEAYKLKQFSNECLMEARPYIEDGFSYLKVKGTMIGNYIKEKMREFR